MIEKIERTEKKDRLLGDEWENWTGDLDESRTYNETSTLFAVYSSLAIVLLLGIIGFVVYMIEPRLNLLHPDGVITVRILAAVTGLIVTVASILILTSVLTGKNFLVNRRIAQVAAARMLPLTLAITRRIGIPRDRLANSFVRFSNAIIRASGKPVDGKTIILLPRCLKPEIKKEVVALGKRAGVGVFTATGGGQARKIIREEHPRAVIGVACERDLISGISDVAPKMPTLGVANRRPEGPCRNTTVNMTEIRRAIEILTGANLD